MNIHFKEEMSGTYKGLAAGFPGGEIIFRTEVNCPDVKDLRVVIGQITGSIDVAGVVTGAPISGTVEISPAWKRIIAYKFTFPLNGKLYRFEGTKRINPLRILKTMTTLPAKVYDENGSEVAEAMTYFKWKTDMVPFLMSYRFAR